MRSDQLDILRTRFTDVRPRMDSQSDHLIGLTPFRKGSEIGDIKQKQSSQSRVLES